MATAADLLALMQALDNELRAEASEPDEARALLALAASQSLFEDVAAAHRGILGSHATITATSGVESTAFPTELIRLDELWMIEDGTSLPSYQLEPIYDTGAHRPDGGSPLSLIGVSAGKPTGYFTNGTNIFWSPVPNSTYTIRWYGLQRATRLTTRAIAFVYGESAWLPIASFAVKLLSLSVGDSAEELNSLAQQTFAPVVRMLNRQVRRMKPLGRTYTRIHTT